MGRGQASVPGAANSSSRAMMAEPRILNLELYGVEAQIHVIVGGVPKRAQECEGIAELGIDRSE